MSDAPASSRDCPESSCCHEGNDPNKPYLSCLVNPCCVPQENASKVSVGDFDVAFDPLSTVAVAGDGGVAIAGLADAGNNYPPKYFAEAGTAGIAITTSAGCARVGQGGVARGVKNCIAMGGAGSAVVVGDDGYAEVRGIGVAYCNGYGGRAKTVDGGGVAFCHHNGVAETGDKGVACVGHDAMNGSPCAAISAASGISVSWEHGTATAGVRGVIILGYKVSEVETHLVVGEIGKQTAEGLLLKPGVAYRLNEMQQIVEA